LEKPPKDIGRVNCVPLEISTAALERISKKSASILPAKL
jgi:hypothetical protein